MDFSIAGWMDFPEVVTKIVTEVGGVAVLATAAAWVFKSVATNWMTKNVESYKHKLKAESDLAIEQIKNDLQIRASEHEVRFRTLHERQARIISIAYALLYRMNQDILAYLNSLDAIQGEKKRERITRIQEANERFKRFYFPRRLFFPDLLANKIEWFHTTLVNITDEYSIELQKQQGDSPNFQPWVDAMIKLDDEAKPMLGEIRHEFQRLIGVVK
jgi:hypothetical protein